MDTPAKTQVTFEEYAALPETNQIVELIDGQIVRERIVNLSPYAHQETLGKAHVFLRSLLRAYPNNPAARKAMRAQAK